MLEVPCLLTNWFQPQAVKDVLHIMYTMIYNSHPRCIVCTSLCIPGFPLVLITPHSFGTMFSKKSFHFQLHPATDLTTFLGFRTCGERELRVQCGICTNPRSFTMFHPVFPPSWPTNSDLPKPRSWVSQNNQIMSDGSLVLWARRIWRHYLISSQEHNLLIPILQRSGNPQTSDFDKLMNRKSENWHKSRGRWTWSSDLLVPKSALLGGPALSSVPHISASGNSCLLYVFRLSLVSSFYRFQSPKPSNTIASFNIEIRLWNILKIVSPKPCSMHGSQSYQKKNSVSYQCIESTVSECLDEFSMV